jgi:hypothetical protein
VDVEKILNMLQPEVLSPYVYVEHHRTVGD